MCMEKFNSLVYIYILLFIMVLNMLQTFFKGAMISASLIIAIGAQNAFVLKQGLLKQHVFWVAFICFICDAILISIGIFGLGEQIGHNTWLSTRLSLAGGLFLLIYGCQSFKKALTKNHQNLNITYHQTTSINLKNTIFTTLAITLLNPHVYLDTVVLIGSLAAPLMLQEKIAFGCGAISISCIWFFTLAYGARWLTPIFTKPYAWRILECLIGMIMWWLATGLLLFFYRHVSG